MNGPGDLALYGNISMFLTIGLLVGLIVFALIERGDATVDDEHLRQLHAALADQRRRRAVLGTPTLERPIVTPMSLPARGAGVTFDVARPGRHRALDAALSIPAAERRPSLATATLAQATAWLAVDHVKREQERVAFTQLMATISTTRSGRALLSGH
jgi:hypothetical protein